MTLPDLKGGMVFDWEAIVRAVREETWRGCWKAEVRVKE
jgi:hypothetical protein